MRCAAVESWKVSISTSCTVASSGTARRSSSASFATAVGPWGELLGTDGTAIAYTEPSLVPEPTSLADFPLSELVSLQCAPDAALSVGEHIRVYERILESSGFKRSKNEHWRVGDASTIENEYVQISFPRTDRPRWGTLGASLTAA
jgi:hypothetical protein